MCPGKRWDLFPDFCRHQAKTLSSSLDPHFRTDWAVSSDGEKPLGFLGPRAITWERAGRERGGGNGEPGFEVGEVGRGEGSQEG